MADHPIPMSAPMKHIISLGAGVQSSTMALMAAHGEITPMPDCAIFADTQSEPRKVYEWLDWLETQLPFPVYRVTKGNLRIDSLRLRVSKTGNKYQKSSPPLFTTENGKSSGLLMRQCTQDYKLQPIYKKMRELIGKNGRATQWLGISMDELQRVRQVRPDKEKWLSNRWPLIDARMTRQHCLDWMRDKGYPKPPRSACTFCPYHSNHEWLQLSANEFEEAVEYEKQIQQTFAGVSGFRGTVYLHRDLVPLDQVDLTADNRQCEMFDEYGFAVECEGMCGV